MTRGRPARWLRIVKRVSVVLAAGSLVLFLLVQLVLATPWAREKVAGQVTKRTGLDCRIGSLSWTPWGGAGIRALVVDQPRELGWDQPLLRIERLRVQPDYVSCFKRQWRVRAVEVDRPELSLSVEMLVAMARRSIPTADPPALAVVEESPAPGPVIPSELGPDGRLPKVLLGSPFRPLQNPPAALQDSRWGSLGRPLWRRAT